MTILFDTEFHDHPPVQRNSASFYVTLFLPDRPFQTNFAHTFCAPSVSCKTAGGHFLELVDFCVLHSRFSPHIQPVQSFCTLSQNSFKSSGRDASLEFLDSDTQSLLALQGPGSMSALQPFVSIDLSRLYFMDSTTATVCGVPGCRITRCGYTGEDGFEISVPSDRAVAVAESLVANRAVKLAGLAVRDTLRYAHGSG